MPNITGMATINGYPVPEGQGARLPRVLQDPSIRDRIIEAMRNGVPSETAAEYAGIHRATFFSYLAKGREELAAREAGQDPDPLKQVFVDLWEAVVQARAEAGARNALVVQKVAQGGFVVKERTRKTKDVETGEIVTEKETDIAPPDWRAAAWYLERQHARVFGKDPVQVELTGAGGGPVEVAAVEAENLAARVMANLAALGAGGAVRELEGNVEDAEVVDDGE